MKARLSLKKKKKNHNINRISKPAQELTILVLSGTGYLKCVNPSCNYCFLKRADHFVVGTSECVNRDGIVRSMRATEWWREQCSSRECIGEVHRLDPAASAAPLLIPCPNLNPAETRFLGARTHTHSSPPSYPFVSPVCFFSKKRKKRKKQSKDFCLCFCLNVDWSGVDFEVISITPCIGSEKKLKVGLQSLQDDLF